MSTKTPNYELTKLDEAELTNLAECNKNVDKIDTALNEVASDVKEIRQTLLDAALNNKCEALSKVAAEVEALQNAFAGISVIDSGKTGALMVPGNGYVDTDITFNKEFKEIPLVVPGFITASVSAEFGKSSCCCLSNSVTFTGCKIRVFNGDTAARQPAVSWIAVGK